MATAGCLGPDRGRFAGQMRHDNVPGRLAETNPHPSGAATRGRQRKRRGEPGRDEVKGDKEAQVVNAGTPRLQAEAVIGSCLRPPAPLSSGLITAITAWLHASWR